MFLKSNARQTRESNLQSASQQEIHREKERDHRRKVKFQVLSELFQNKAELCLAFEQPGSERDRRQKQSLAKEIHSLLKRQRGLPSDSLEGLVQEILGQMETFGPLADLVLDPEIDEIQVNRLDRIFLQRGQDRQLSQRIFQSERHLTVTLQRVAYPLTQIPGQTEQIRQGRLDAHTQVLVILPPLARGGGNMVLRRLRSELQSLDALQQAGVLDDTAKALLKEAVQQRDNLLVIGPPGVGKTTLLSALLREVSPEERIVSIEKRRELESKGHGNWVQLEAGADDGNMEQLARCALEMGAQRLIIGECDGAELQSLLGAMRGAIQGSMSTLVASSTEQLNQRLWSLLRRANPRLEKTELSFWLENTIDRVLEMGWSRQGHRKLLRITGMKNVPGEPLQWESQLVLHHEDGEGSA